MRRVFGKLMAELAEKDDKVVLLVGDIGYKIFDELKTRFPERFINIGLCEQSMISVASGMALEGLKPWVYTITPFLIERPFEQIKLDINQQNVNVKLIGYADYPTQGPTHAEINASRLVSLLNNIKSFFPKDSEETINSFWEAYNYNGPIFMSLKEDTKYKKYGEISDILAGQLPKIIKKIAKNNNVVEYSENPDFFDERLRKWHQYGLLTHTLKTREAFESLESKLGCELYKAVDKKLQEEVADVKKRTLLDISIILHDLGKITCLYQRAENREHELASAALLDTEFLKNKLIAMGLEKEHIKYVRRCIEAHGAVGKKIRDKLKEKLKLEYENCERIREMCRNLAKEYSDVGLEIGLFFVCDSLGKLNMGGNKKSEKEIIETLRKRGLPEDLMFGIMQQPANLELGQIYLKEVISQPC